MINHEKLHNERIKVHEYKMSRTQSVINVDYGSVRDIGCLPTSSTLLVLRILPIIDD